MSKTTYNRTFAVDTLLAFFHMLSRLNSYQ